MRRKPGQAAKTGGPAEGRPAGSAAVSGRSNAAPRPARPASVLEVRVFPGRIEVNEYFSDGQAQALAAALEAHGVRTERSFSSRCG